MSRLLLAAPFAGGVAAAGAGWLIGPREAPVRSAAERRKNNLLMFGTNR